MSISHITVNYIVADDIVLEKVNSPKVINHTLHQFSISPRGSLIKYGTENHIGKKDLDLVQVLPPI